VPTCARAFKAKAFDFLEKPVDHDLLLDHIHRALACAAGQKRPAAAAEFGGRLGRLTPAEKEVMDLLISGRSLKEIAIARNVTVQTVWRHRLNVLSKVGVENDVELVRTATQAAYEPNR
jgi:FixJ family two-component response regulator